jgi:RND family efflux transporter MFP subunit
MTLTHFDRLTSLLKQIRRCLPWLSACLIASAGAAQGGVSVAVAPVQAKTVASGFEFEGVIQPVKQSILSAQAGGRIVSLAVRAGDKVRAGQVLVTIDDQEAQTGMQRSQAMVAQAQAELRNAQANFNRTRDLQAQGFLSAAALDTADAQLKSALAGRDQAGAGARQSALAKGFTRVSAPFDAWVLQTHVDSGDLAVPGKPLLTLYAPLPLRAVVQVPVSRASQAQAAGAVEVLVPRGAAAPQWVRPLAISRVPTADPVSQTIEWRLDLSPEAARNLLPGQQVRVRFAGAPVERLLVAASAVLRRGELTAVYVVSGSGFVLKAVRLGAEHGADGVEILAGVQAGERVALEPVKAGLAGARAFEGH